MHKITEQEVEDVKELSSPRTPVIYEIVRRQGEEEMARPLVSLWWSGVAAGLSISFSLLAQAILQTHLPDTPWRPLVADLGYSAGFIMVVMSRQQLFTESTITAVLPVMADIELEQSRQAWANVGRGADRELRRHPVCRAVLQFTPVLTPELFNGMLDISRHILGHSLPEMFFSGIAAGFLMAALVWLIPSAETAQFYVIVLMTYLISAGSFMHIVAGSVEAFLLVLNGDIQW